MERFRLDRYAQDALENCLITHLKGQSDDATTLVMQALRSYYLSEALYLNPNAATPRQTRIEAERAIADLLARAFYIARLAEVPFPVDQLQLFYRQLTVEPTLNVTATSSLDSTFALNEQPVSGADPVPDDADANSPAGWDFDFSQMDTSFESRGHQSDNN